MISALEKMEEMNRLLPEMKSLVDADKQIDVAFYYFNGLWLLKAFRVMRQIAGELNGDMSVDPDRLFEERMKHGG